ncbi:MAG: RNA polymerase sigma-I factor [Oscillospiraceae bacterium]
MIDLDLRVGTVADNPTEREKIIREYKPFILKCASDSAKRYITDSDDEWSIALQAFSEAIDKYKSDEGHFLSFAKLVIRRRLYDYFDLNQKYGNEISVAPAMFSGEIEEEEELSEVYLQVKKNLSYTETSTVAEEISAAGEVFAQYGFSFFDLTSCSPKAEKTKISCTKAAVYMIKNPILVTEMKRTKQLPMKIIEENAQVPRKILDRHRKYIIAVVEIFYGEYPSLADYLRPIREELKR